MDIIITGLSKVGKSSIKKVVFEKMSPHESVYLETSNIIESCSLDNLGYTYLVVRDYPFNYRYENANQTELKYLSTCGVLIYVIDSQDISDITFEHFKKVVLSVLQKNPKVQVDVFLHKLDGAYFLQNNTHSQRFQEINSTINKIFSEVQIEKMANIYKTSIYDHSLFEAFSKIFQRLMPQNAMFSKLLDYLTNSCKFEKAYLFDVTNKIYIGVDNSPIDEQLYETCTDMIDVVLDMSGIYNESSDGMIKSSFDENSNSIISINNVNKGDDSKTYLYLRFIDENLALISVINDENFDRQHMIDYNIKLFREAVKEILSLTKGMVAGEGV
jgi:Ras-related GTP-binding protein C/D